jgi:hypothetical protein
MASAWQKSFNKSLDNYISTRRDLSERYERPSGSNIFSSAKNRPETAQDIPMKQRPDKMVELEGKELEMSEDLSEKKGFFSRLQDMFFGERAAIENEAKDMLGGKSYTAAQAHYPGRVPSASYVGPIPTKSSFEYKPSAEQELKFTVKLTEALIQKLSPQAKKEFLKSREYKLFENISEKY